MIHPTPGDRPAPNPRGTRSVVMARHGMIATSQPLASAAGLRILQEGGNAIDAALTAAATLAVVEPSMTGIGGDLFALVYDARARTLRGLNASGRAARAATISAFAAHGLQTMPLSGVHTVTVPGVVDGWAQLLSEYGTRPLSRIVAPAIEYARNGYPVSEIVAEQWRNSAAKLAADSHAAATFLKRGRAPTAGEVVTNRQLAGTLECIGRDGRDAFYTGSLAQALVADLTRRGSLLSLGDFADHHADWVEPITTNYRGYDVYELPPNTQGFVVLEILNLLEGFDVAGMGHNSADYLHTMVEAKRIAFADRAAHLADPASVPAHVLARLLSKEYAAARRTEIDPRRAVLSYAPAHFEDGAHRKAVPEDAQNLTGRDRGDTVYLTAADGDGNMISLIQSIYSDFGAGIVAGDTGVVLHNRGSGFTLSAGSPNQIGPHKRPLHTLIPAFVMKDGAPWMSFGVMGGDHQAQGHVQVLANLIDFGMNPQDAGDAARVTHGASGLLVESAIPEDVRRSLAARGHVVTPATGAFGGYQGIRVDGATRVFTGGSDVRKDGQAVGW